eukprot:gene30845-38126_t
MLGYTIGKGEKPNPISGMGTGLLVYDRTVRVTINGHELEDVPVVWMREGKGGPSSPLIGRKGIFEHFIITVDETDDIARFKLKKQNKKQASDL